MAHLMDFSILSTERSHSRIICTSFPRNRKYARVREAILLLSRLIYFCNDMSKTVIIIVFIYAKALLSIFYRISYIITFCFPSGKPYRFQKSFGKTHFFHILSALVTEIRGRVSRPFSLKEDISRVAIGAVLPICRFYDIHPHSRIFLDTFQNPSEKQSFPRK